VAVALFTAPQEPVTFTQYEVAASSLGVVYEGDVAPLIAVPLPLVPLYHWYESVPVPVAVAERTVVVFFLIATLCG
jgi:hypothetical protein